MAGEAIGARRTVASLGAEMRVVAAYRARLDAEEVGARVRRAAGQGVGRGFSLSATFFLYFVGFLFGAHLMRTAGYTFDDAMKVFLSTHHPKPSPPKRKPSTLGEGDSDWH